MLYDQLITSSLSHVQALKTVMASRVRVEESVLKRKVTTSSDVSVLQDSKGSCAKKVIISILIN